MKIENWVEQTRVYPPGHIYAGMPQGKQEKQAVQLCEQLYKFNFGDKRNVLGDLHAAWWTVKAFILTYQRGPYLEPRAEYVDKIFTEFLEAAKASIDAMDKVFKQHQAVNEYYKEWRMSFQDMKAEAWLLRSSIQ